MKKTPYSIAFVSLFVMATILSNTLVKLSLYGLIIGMSAFRIWLFYKEERRKEGNSL